ncbi:hypothetical protein [Actinomadura chibensis]|uniref:hypothetical protein n=1 Tax=Actinomadura chibensis TaxID=392828 RepID=UPI000B06E21B|nr:hypothetical protein [Actinomadura chibensis]
MSMSHDVTIYKINYREGKEHPYGVRWKVRNKRHSRWYQTEALADSERSALIQAARRGEGFDVESGWPESKLREMCNVPWFQHAVEYIDEKWPAASANHRVSMVETLVTVTAALVAGKRGEPDPDVLRRALRNWAFNPRKRDEPRSAQTDAALRWVAKATPAVSDLADHDVLRTLLDACAKNLDGTPSAPAYFSRRRRVLSNALRYAVSRKRLGSNPLHDESLHWEPPRRDEEDEEVDPRVVGSPEQMRLMLTAIGKVGRTQARGSSRSSRACTSQCCAPRRRSASESRTASCRPPAGGGSLSPRRRPPRARHGPTAARSTKSGA